MQKICKQFDDMLIQGSIPVFEFQCKDEHGNVDWYTFELSMHPDGVCLEFDATLKTWFSGYVVKLSDYRYLLPFDDRFDNLDEYLEEINLEIIEGYLIPNKFEILA